MYSYEDRIRAVHLYISLGKRGAATVRQLGYPTTKALTRWHRQYERGHDLPARYVRLRPKYSAEQKRGAVDHYLHHGQCLAWTSKALGYPGRGTLAAWVDELRPETRKRIVGKVGALPQPQETRQAAVIELCMRQESARVIAQRLARSSYFYHRSRLQVTDKYAGLRDAITEIFTCNHSCYGYRRIRAALGRRNISFSEKVVRRLMKQEGLAVSIARRRRYRSYQGEISPAPENLINRDFRAAAPNEKWLTDITEFQISAGKVYLSPIIDCFDGLVISWSIGMRPDAEFVNTMLDAAIETVAADNSRPVIHSDRGAHYRWPGWLTRIRDAGLARSMSRKGCSPDNAACEGFFGRLKTELFYSRDWQTTSVEQFIKELDAYIRWYNEKRIKISLGSLSPLEYRESLGLAA